MRSSNRGRPVVILLLLATALLLYGVAAVAEGEKADNPPDLTEMGLEEISINGLENLYGPAEFTHKAHVEYTGNCTECHHHSPAGEYPACSECHSSRKILKPAQGQNGVRSDDKSPGLKAAFHQQCMACHKDMGSGPMGCTDCHAKKQPAKKKEAK
ncbi:MAG: cytochrome c3 family protein [Candidatus Lernaella stagnicola]|nr:cytochrome c3 family protein [Candidatus Lernaella stagnicola]